MSAATAPLITLVIPTRERAETLAFTLRSAISQQSADYEILVSDNFSQDATAQVVAAVKDPRIRYIRTESRLSMCDNWEFALGSAHGKYVIYIGDDDAVMPGGIDRLAALVAQRPSQAFMWTPAIYRWPIDEHGASVRYLPSSMPVHELDLRRKARFTMTHGGWKYYEIPGVYHGAIARETLDRIRQKVGRVFKSTQPDLFTSMAVPAFTPTGIYTGRPITVHGMSAKSNSGSSTAKDGAAVMGKFVQEVGEYRVHPTLFQEGPSLVNLFVDPFLVAKDSFPEFYGDIEFNYEAMWAFLYKLNLVAKRDVFRWRHAIRKYHSLSIPRFLMHAWIQDLVILRRKVINRFQNKGPFGREVSPNVWEFAQKLNDWQAPEGPPVSKGHAPVVKATGGPS